MSFKREIQRGSTGCNNRRSEWWVFKMNTHQTVLKSKRRFDALIMRMKQAIIEEKREFCKGRFLSRRKGRYRRHRPGLTSDGNADRFHRF